MIAFHFTGWNLPQQHVAAMASKLLGNESQCRIQQLHGRRWIPSYVALYIWTQNI
jgi:hypothetical protein